jgi:16S rRNA U516 pseudouridylate synthase RsuA-like enzyme
MLLLCCCCCWLLLCLQVRLLVAAAGLRLLRLKRVRVGGFVMPDKLREGQYM